MTSEAEILVHITAPSTSKDDTLYRTFASAYLNFEPGKTINLPADTKSVHSAPLPEVLLSPQASFQSVWDNVRPRNAQPHSQQSVSGQNSSQDGKASQTSWVQPPSEVADSMPDNDIRIEGFTTPTRLMSYFLQTQGPPSDELCISQEIEGKDATSVYVGNDELIALLANDNTNSILQRNALVQTAEHSDAFQPTNNSRSTSITNVLAEGANAITHDDNAPNAPINEVAGSFQHNDDIQYVTPEHDKTTSDSRVDESHISQTPSSPLQSQRAPTSSTTRLSGNSIRTRSSKRVRTSPQSPSELPGITIPATQLPERAGTEPPSSNKRLKTKTSSPFMSSSSGSSHHNLERSTSDILPRGSKESAAPVQTTFFNDRGAAAAATATAPQANVRWSHETHLLPAEPSPSNHKLGPRAPLKLELVMRNFGLDGRYRPKFQARKLRQHERGYWLVDLTGWDHPGKLEAWCFLGDFICRDGFAGWGTRACRDEEWTWIRLYGWEHIAGELYILLYVASLRRLKAMELTWYDGAGKELIVVAARSDKSLSDFSKGTIGV